MTIVVIDGQGGGIGRSLIEAIKAQLPDQEVIAAGANALATSAMLRAGADAGATGENAICHLSAKAHVILGPMGILQADAMYGEITPAMALAIGRSEAQKILIPVQKCRIWVACTPELPMSQYIQGAVAQLLAMLKPQR